MAPTSASVNWVSFPVDRIVLVRASASIVKRGDWLGSPANIKGANKDVKIYVGRSMTVHNLLFCACTLCMNYITNKFFFG